MTDQSRVARPRSLNVELALSSLLQGHNIPDSAKAAGIGRRTLTSWLASDWFREKYEAAKREMLNSTINQLRTVANECVQTLHQLMTDELTPPAARATAARTLLELLLRAVETQDLAVRLERLEDTLREEVAE